MPDRTATSGVAKNYAISQSVGRLESKRIMKNAAYAELDKLIFQLYLSYSDDKRRFSYLNSQGAYESAVFDKMNFLEMTKEGEWRFIDDYLFSCDQSVDMSQSKEMLWKENRENYLSGAFGNPDSAAARIIFWQNMERARYPYASENIERIKSQQNEEARTAKNNNAKAEEENG